MKHGTTNSVIVNEIVKNVLVSDGKTAGQIAGPIYVGDFPTNPWEIRTPVETPVPMPWKGFELNPNTFSSSFITGYNPWRMRWNSDESVVYELDVPGCNASGIELTIVDKKIVVKATKKSGAYANYEMEIISGYDSSSADASIDDGILTIVFKKAKHENVRKISVRQGPVQA